MLLFYLQAGIFLHSSGIVNNRLECIFSRVIPVVDGETGSDFNLDEPYYIMIGTGNNPGK